MEDLRATRAAPSLPKFDRDRHVRLSSVERQRKIAAQLHPAHSARARRRLAKHTQPGAARYRRQIQFYRERAQRSLSFTRRLPPRSRALSSELLRISPGIYSAGTKQSLASAAASMKTNISVRLIGVLGALIPISVLIRTYFGRSEEHTSELQSRFGISYAVFCFKK